MFHRLIIITLFSVAALQAAAQQTKPRSRVKYFVDSVPAATAPQISQEDLAYYDVVVYPETRKIIRFPAYDSLVFLFTKAWVDRPAELKQIPATGQLTLFGDQYYYKGQPYTGKVIDYYYDGKVRHRGAVKKGKLEGTHFYYNPSGTAMRRTYTNRSNGVVLVTETDSEGRLTRREERYRNRPEQTETYYANGRVKSQYSVTDKRTLSVSYYSSGLLRDSVVTYRGKNKKVYRPPHIQQYYQLVDNREYAKARERYPGHPGPYPYLAQAAADSLQFDKAARYMDTCLLLEPYESHLYLQRAYIRLAKYAYAATQEKRMSEEALTRYLNTNPPLNIPTAEKQQIISDLKKCEALDKWGFGYFPVFADIRNWQFLRLP
ncbi:hypothetical protein [Chitinophaga alhagiae]|uniref:hypothetical protein n=1 Tax=Chitinophaga alhagiae TaxID=2203219 RepID=UPI000E5BBACD|nr:hypothetical protein [Chitinophaga alhagiae]